MAIYQRKKTTYTRNGKKRIKYVRRKQPVKGDPWYIDYYDVNGKRRREKIGPNKRLAENVLMKRKVEAAENKNLDVNKIKKIKFFDFADEYLEVYSKNNKKSYLTDVYRSQTLKKYLGNKYLHQITPLMLEKFKIKRKKEVKLSTVNHELKLFRAMYNKAIEWGKAQKNPMDKVDLFKVNNNRLRYLEKEEIKNLIACAPPHLKPVIRTAVNTGVRKGNILKLKWGDLDFKRDIIYIRDSKNNEGRDIPMNKNLKNCLKKIKDKRNPAGSEYVFTNSYGKQYKDIRRAFAKARKEA
jgi:integrase